MTEQDFTEHHNSTTEEVADAKVLPEFEAIDKPVPTPPSEAAEEDEAPAIIAPPAEQASRSKSERMAKRNTFQVVRATSTVTAEFSRTSVEDTGPASRMSDSLYARVFGRRAIPSQISISRPGMHLYILI